MFSIVNSSLVVLSWLAPLLLLRPNKLKLHRRRLLTSVGGIGGFVCTFIFGWVGLYDGRCEDGGNESCVNIWEDVDNVGNEFEDGEAGVAGIEKSDVAGLDPEPQASLVSGNGYSNRVLSLSFAKGVPTIWEDGEWRHKSSRFIALGIMAIGFAEEGKLGIWESVVWLPMVSTTVPIDIESDISESTWGVEAESCAGGSADTVTFGSTSTPLSASFSFGIEYMGSTALEEHMRISVLRRGCVAWRGLPTKLATSARRRVLVASWNDVNEHYVYAIAR